MAWLIRSAMHANSTSCLISLHKRSTLESNAKRTEGRRNAIKTDSQAYEFIFEALAYTLKHMEREIVMPDEQCSYMTLRTG